MLNGTRCWFCSAGWPKRRSILLTPQDPVSKTSSGAKTHRFGSQVLGSIVVVQLQQPLTGRGKVAVVMPPPVDRFRLCSGREGTKGRLRTQNTV